MTFKQSYNNAISRRAFVRNASLAAASAVASAVSHRVHAAQEARDGRERATPASKILNYNVDMNYRRLGKTGLMVSEVGLGGHWSNRQGGRLWMQFANDEVPADVAKNRVDVVSKCIERGVNFVDPVTLAELMAYGIALNGRRDRMFVAASSDAYNPVRQERCTVENQLANIDDCLTRLRTDYLDVWRPMFRQEGGHPDSDIEACALAFEKAKEQGKVRWLGMSSHNRAFIQHVIEEFPQYSVVIFPYTAMSKAKGADAGSLDPNQVVEIGTGDRRHSGDVSKSIFDIVREKDIGVVTIKPFGGGSLFRTRITFEENATSEDDDRRARLTLACILCNEKITTTIPGMTTIQQVDNNVRASKERRSWMTQEGLSALDQAAKEMWANLPDEYRWLRDWEWV